MRKRGRTNSNNVDPSIGKNAIDFCRTPDKLEKFEHSFDNFKSSMLNNIQPKVLFTGFDTQVWRGWGKMAIESYVPQRPQLKKLFTHQVAFTRTSNASGKTTKDCFQ